MSVIGRKKNFTNSNRTSASSNKGILLSIIFTQLLAMHVVTAEGNNLVDLKTPKSMTTYKTLMDDHHVRGGGAAVNNKNNNHASGSAIRNALFPIHGKEEVTKFLLIGSIKFFVILALTLTRDNKDTMVVTEVGAEAIAFLKVRMCVCTFAIIMNTSKRVHTITISRNTTCFTDLWCSSSCNLIHCSVFQNGNTTGEENIVLRYLFTILCVLLPF
jgi:hypothetical protein